MAPRRTIPTLADLALEPARASEVPPAEIPAFLTQIGAVQAALAAQLLRAFALERAEDDARRVDRLLTVNEAATRLAVTKYWLYTHSGTLPFTVRMGDRSVRFSEKGIERYLRQRQGTG